MTSEPKTGSRLYLLSIVMVAVIGGLLFGYDTAVVSGAEQALDQFFRTARDFDYTPWLHGFTASSALLGCIIGGAISGFCASRLGRKRSLIVAAVLFFVSAVGSWWPESGILPYGEASRALLISFNFYRIIGGVGVGLASALCPMYIAEISPARIRGTLVSCNQFAIIFGMLVVYFVNYLIRNNLGDTAEAIQTAMVAVGWRRMFLSEAFPAGAFLLLILLVPETPRYLALKGDDRRAFAVLERINGTSEAHSILADIKSTVHERRERLFAYGGMVIAVGVLLSFFQQAIGINVVLYYAPRIFANMGATGDASMLQTVVMGVVNIIFTVVAIFTVDKVGRKPLLMIGSTGMMIGMLALAVLSFTDAIGLAALVFIILYTASFMMSWGPICWVLISEIFPNTIRSQAVAIAVAAQWVSNFLVSATFPSLSGWSVGGAPTASKPSCRSCRPSSSGRWFPRPRARRSSRCRPSGTSNDPRARLRALSRTDPALRGPGQRRTGPQRPRTVSKVLRTADSTRSSTKTPVRMVADRGFCLIRSAGFHPTGPFRFRTPAFHTRETGCLTRPLPATHGRPAAPATATATAPSIALQQAVEQPVESLARPLEARQHPPLGRQDNLERIGRHAVAHLRGSVVRENLQPRHPILRHSGPPPLLPVVAGHADNLQPLPIAATVLLQGGEFPNAPRAPRPPEVDDHILAPSEKSAQPELLAVDVLQRKVRRRAPHLQLRPRGCGRLLLPGHAGEDGLYHVDVASETPVPHLGREPPDGGQYLRIVLVEQEHGRKLVVGMAAQVSAGNHPQPPVYGEIGRLADAVGLRAVEPPGHIPLIPGPHGVKLPVEGYQLLPEAVEPLIEGRAPDAPVAGGGKGALHLRTLAGDEKERLLPTGRANGQRGLAGLHQRAFIGEETLAIDGNSGIHHPLFRFAHDVLYPQRIVRNIGKTPPERKIAGRQIQGHGRQQGHSECNSFHSLRFFVRSTIATRRLPERLPTANGKRKPCRAMPAATPDDKIRGFARTRN